jgi:hypothetical protein
MKRIALISCCGEKLARVAPARELYRSQLFRKSVAWASRQGFDGWFVLSARYGLIRPDEQLAPYDYSARQMSPAERAAWEQRVAEQLDAYTIDDERVEITLLAGEVYAGWIPKVQAFATVLQPLKGMQIGERMSWLNREADGQAELILEEVSE